MVVQVEASEQAVHVVSAAAVIALQLYDDSHPLVESASLLNFPLVHDEMPVQVDASEQAMQVALVTGIAAQ